MLRFLKVMLVAIVLLVGTTACAEWRIDFESKTVSPGETGVTLDVTAYWDIGLSAFIVPVIVREIDAGAFWTGTLPYDIDGNAFNHPFVQGVTWNWTTQWAVLVEEVRPSSGSTPGAPPPCTTPADSSYDGISPDQFAIIAVGAIASEPPQPDGRVVVILTFDVTATAGDFEFDTACLNASLSTIFMIDDQFPPVEHGHSVVGTGETVFNKGIITIASGCDCPFQGDASGDGLVDPVDVVYLIHYAFRGGPSPIVDEFCPCLNRGDWDCDGRANLVDVVQMVGYVFRNWQQGPIDPCAD